MLPFSAHGLQNDVEPGPLGPTLAPAVAAARGVVAVERPEARIEVGVQELEVVEDHGGRGRS